MQKISTARKTIYLLILGALPLFFVLVHYFSSLSEQKSLDLSLDDAIMQAAIKNKKEHTNLEVRRIFSDADHFYIDKEIEKLQLLVPQTSALRAHLTKGYHPDEEEIKKRLQFLTGNQNRIAFSEGSIKSYKDFQETIETFTHPVEVDFVDLQRIISRIEGTHLVDETLPPNRPHLIITECKLEKKKALLQDVFLLDLKVLKREYVK